jgi:hypothetical protein
MRRFVMFNFTTYCSDDQVKEVEVGGDYYMCGRREKCENSSGWER